MANRTDPTARSVHGTNPQNLVEKILRSKIYQNTYWKEQCFGLTGRISCSFLEFFFQILIAQECGQKQENIVEALCLLSLWVVSSLVLHVWCLAASCGFLLNFELDYSGG